MNTITTLSKQSILYLALLVFLLTACQREALPEAIADVPAVTIEATLASPAATWTAVPAVSLEEPTGAPTEPPPATSTPLPTSTLAPASTLASATDTPEATPVPTEAPTNTPPPAPTSPPPPAAPPATAVPPTLPPNPQLGVNLLPNPSFEEGHYNQDGIPELQLPNRWRLEWDAGPTGVGNEAWDVYVRPEIRVLSASFLPPAEHALYIYDGQHTVKIFKGGGAVNFRLLTDVTLDPGTYVIEAKMFADIIERWEDGQKVWAGDPYAAEFRFLVGNGGTVWTTQRFGQVNVHNFTFTIDQSQTIPIGVGLRGRYAIANNGWFMDDFSLRRVQ